MTDYRWLNPDHTAVRRLADGACIPADPANADYIRLVDEEVEIAPFQRFETLDVAQDARLRELSERRKAAERAFTFAGRAIDLDEGTQGRLFAALKYLELSGEDSVRWQVARGRFQSFTARELETLAEAAGAHVQACFANVEALAGEIAAAQTVAAVEAVDLEAGWP